MLLTYTYFFTYDKDLQEKDPEENYLGNWELVGEREANIMCGKRND